MQVVELIAINQAKYNKILIMETKEDSNDPYIENVIDKKLYTDMNLVDRVYYNYQATDYFLLDKEGLSQVVYRNKDMDIEIDENDKILVIII